MSFHGRQWLVASALAVTLGCSAEMSVEPSTAVEELRCGNRTCALPNATARCSRGRCVIASCFTQRGDCNHIDADGCEVNVTNDVRHCGGCGIACGARSNTTATCVQGVCTYACSAGYADCDGDAANGCEVNLRTDDTNCGVCGQRFDYNYDVAHCGGCGNACPAPPNGYPYCRQGTCGFDCDWAYGDCDRQAGNGCETAIRADDPNNCGACGQACLPGRVCDQGACRCPTGQGECHDPATGGYRCIDVWTDVTNCGWCGNTCAAGATCQRGTCVCAEGQTTCYDFSSGGYRCADLTSDASHCGWCGGACGAGEICNSGICIAACPAGNTLCRAGGATWCADLTSNTANCGACGGACAPGATCEAGACVGGSCSAPLTYCGGRCADLTSDRANCGACGNACSPGVACLAGRCNGYTITRGTLPLTDACTLPGATVGILRGDTSAGVGVPIPLPFAFPFFGASYSTVRPASRGYVLFGSGPGPSDMSGVPTGPAPSEALPRPAAFVLHTYLLQSTSAGMCAGVTGTAPDRRFVITTRDAYEPRPDARFTFEVVLNEADGSMDFVYGAIPPYCGSNTLVGLQDETGAVGSTWQFAAPGTPFEVTSNTSLHLAPPR